MPEQVSTVAQSERAAASRLARIAAVIAFVFALVAIAATLGDDGGTSGTSTVTRTVKAPGAPTRTITTESPQEEGSGFDTLLNSDALRLFLQLGLAAVVAFAAGAIVQRVWLGEYGITLGPVSIPSLPPVSAASAAQVVDRIEESPTLGALMGPGPRRPQPFPQFWNIEDDRLALISIRAELEIRLRELAVAAELDSEIALSKLPQRLVRQGVLDNEAADGILGLLHIGDRIVAGAKVEPSAESKIENQAREVLYALGELRRRALEQRKTKKAETKDE